MRYLVLGAGGMAGHLIANYLLEQGEEVIGLARRTLDYCDTIVLDATDLEQLETVIKENAFDYVINCIGILNSDAEGNKERAIRLNSLLPHFLVRITEGINTKIIHMSTDCVFSGEKGHYLESDFPDGKTYYDRTKALGEINDCKNLTLRCSIIGPDINAKGIGLFNWFMQQSGEVNGYEKSIWTGVTTLTLAKAMHKASKQGLTGLYHLVNNDITNKYELLQLFNKYTKHGLKINRIDGVAHDKSLICTRSDFAFEVPSYEKQVEEMVEWIESHPNFYAHYN